MTPYKGYKESSTEDAIVHNFPGTEIGTYIIRPEDMPASPYMIAAALNRAYDHGYAAAQADMRRAMGVA